MLNCDSTLSSVSKTRNDLLPGLVRLSTGLRNFYQYQSPITTYYDTYPNPSGLSFSKEKIAYDRGRAFFKNVVQTKEIRSLRESPKYWINSTFPGTNPVNYSTFMMPDWYAALAEGTVPGHPNNPSLGLITIQLTDLDGALRRAHRNMLPRMEDISGGTNIANFILELRDIKTMFSLWKRSFGVLRNLSAGVLNYSYAWKPFISDLQNIHGALTRMNDYVDRWNKDAKAGQIWTRHADISGDVWRTDQSATSSSIGSTFGAFCQNHTGTNDYYTSYVESVVVKAHLAFKPNRLAFSGLNKLAAYFDVAGLGDPLSIIWEAIPFSFLVDYFVSVGKFVSQFDHDFTFIPITIVNFGYSIKTSQRYTYRRDIRIKRVSNGAITLFPGSEAFYDYKVYSRKRIGLPPPVRGNPLDVDLGLLEFHWPSLRQAFLMVNLANVLRR